MNRNVLLAAVIASLLLGCCSPKPPAIPEVPPEGAAAVSDLDAQPIEQEEAEKDVYALLMRYKVGASRKPLKQIELSLVGASSEIRNAAEMRLVDVLRDPAATFAAKEFPCRILRRIGTDTGNPTLAGLLGDDELAHMARYALARPGDEAAIAALRNALPSLQGERLAGVIRSLGSLRDPQSLHYLDSQLPSSNPAVTQAATEAVGQIGGADAVRILQRALSEAPDAQRPALIDALFACAESFLAAGNREAALAIYRPMYAPEQPPLLRFAALDGIVRAQQAQAVPLLLDLLNSSEPEVQSAAAQYVRDLKTPGVTQAFANRLGDLAPTAKVALLGALGTRGDPDARPAVLAALEDEMADVRAAAVVALEALGSDEDVLVLARYAATQRGKPREAAIHALSRLPGSGVEQELVERLDSRDARVRIVLLEAIAERDLRNNTPDILRLLSDDETNVRVAALNALQTVGNNALLPDVLAHLLTAQSRLEREAVSAALVALSRAEDTTGACVTVLASASVTATAPAVHGPILRALGQLGGERALWAVRMALADEQPGTVDAAVRALCDWPDPGVVAELIRIAKTGNETHRVLSLRAVCRLLGERTDRSSDELLELYEQALAAAARPEEKRLVLGGLATLTLPGALDLVRPHLVRAELRHEAALAYAKIARCVVGIDPHLAMSAAREATAVSDNEQVQREAQGVIDLARSMADYIMNWAVSGPWTAPGVKREALLHTSFLPEEDSVDNVEWEPMPVGRDPAKPWLLELTEAIGGDNRAAYLLTYIHSAEQRPARLELGSDDAVKVWLNGRRIHANLVWRGVNPGDDVVPITLYPGWNQLLLKVVQGGGDWGACVRIVAPDGSSLGGFRTTTMLTAEDEQALVPLPPPTPVLVWSMDRDEEEVLQDASGYGATTVPKGGPAFAEGACGQALECDGVDDEIRVKIAHLPIEAEAQWTLNMCVFLDEQPEELTIIGGFGDVKSARPVGCQRFLVKFKGGIHFWGSCIDVNPSVPFDVGRWQMVTITYDGETVTIYKDGKQLIASKEPLAEAAPYAVVTPLDHWKKGNRLKGLIDEFSIWNGALTAEQVAALAEKTLPRQNTLESGGLRGRLVAP